MEIISPLKIFLTYTRTQPRGSPKRLHQLKANRPVLNLEGEGGVGGWGGGWVEGRGEGEGLQVNKFEQVLGCAIKDACAY